MSVHPQPGLMVGFAGLGRMGSEMVRNLARASFPLVLWNRTSRKAEQLASEIGCPVASSPRDLAERCDIVVTMLADDRSSANVHFGPDGLFASDRAKTLVEMGTLSLDHISELVAGAPIGIRVIDAPVSGATQAAREAQLLIMAGCNEQDAALVLPIFKAMGRETVFLGQTGAGSVMKLAVNSLIHGINQTLAEAMTLAESTGIAPNRAFDVIEASAACAPMLKYRRPLYLDEKGHDVTFTVALARKDMEVTAALAKKQGVAMPQGMVTLKKLKQAEAAGFAGRDMASMLNFMREESK